MKLIDLTHNLDEQVPNWDLGCGFKKTIKLDYVDCKNQFKFKVEEMSCPLGIGTHMDAPSHCFPGALSITQIPLEKLFLSCVMIDVTKEADENYRVSIDDIKIFEDKYGQIPDNSFVIIYTGWCRYWKEPNRYRNDLKFPSLSLEAAEFLLMRNIAGLGIDTLSPDSGGTEFPVHQALLGAGKYIIENIFIDEKLPPVDAKIIALPLKISNATESPLRLIAVIEN